MLFDRYKVIPALYMALILALSSIPGTTDSGSPAGPAGWIPPIVSNAMHVPVYAGLAWLWAWALLHSRGIPARRAALIALALTAVFGGIDELYQGLIPGRTTAFGDWLADAAGGALGSCFFLGTQHWARQPPLR
jgi:VanZ family protein